MKDYRAAKKRVVVTVGESVRILRELQELSQNQLSEASGISQATISAIENDRVRLGVERAKVLGKDTGLLFGMWESHQEPHSRGPVLHYHARMTEMFWVLEGVLHVEAGDQVIDAPAGGFALVPPGTIHTFRNASDEPSKILIMFSPGFNREMYFEGMAEHRRRDLPPTPEEVLELMHSFDQYLPGEIASEIIAQRGS